MKVKLYLLILLSGLLLSLQSKAIEVYGVNSQEDSLIILNTETGAVTNLGPIHPDANRYTTPVRMAIRPGNGSIFIVNNSPDSDQGISRVDPSGGVTMIAPYTDDISQIDSIVFTSRGKLIAQYRNGEIAHVNINTGEYNKIDGVQFDALFTSWVVNPQDGLMYGAQTIIDPRFDEMRLFKMDENFSILEEFFVDIPDSLGNVRSVIFSPEGHLIVVSSHFSQRFVFTLDLSNQQIISGPHLVNNQLSPQAMGYHFGSGPTAVPAVTLLAKMFLCLLLSIVGLIFMTRTDRNIKGI